MFHEVRERIQEEMIAYALPSLSVAIAQGKNVLWEESFGWADRENRVLATSHTMYSLASITKPITATGIMILRERGLLDLDQPIDTYLRDNKLQAWVGNAEEATVRRVANHTSGLPQHYQLFYQDEPYRLLPRSETIRRYGNLVAAPGERFLYSNMGYGLLDEIIARLSGKSYADFLREEVFLPLGMLHASVAVAPGLEAFEARRYGADGVVYPFYESDHPGATDVYCSAHDLVRFGMFHLKQHLSNQKAILSDASLDEMQNGPSPYGIGWIINQDNMGYRSIGHNGKMGGVCTNLWLLPEAQVVVVVLANTSWKAPFLPYEVAQDLIGVLLPTYAEKLAQRRSEQATKQEEGDRQRESFAPPQELLGSWNGYVHTYEGDIPLIFWFKETGDVHARLGTQLKTLVNDVQFKECYLTGKMMGDIGTSDASRRPHLLHVDLKQRGNVLNGAITTITIEDQEGGVPGRREGNTLSYWTELRKEG